MKHMTSHLKHEAKSYYFDYLLIASAATLFIIAMKLFAGEKTVQVLMIVSFAGFYVTWGIYHHVMTKTLRIKILLEYVLIAIAMLFLTLTIALR